jgi:hypothetical protein
MPNSPPLPHRPLLVPLAIRRGAAGNGYIATYDWYGVTTFNLRLGDPLLSIGNRQVIGTGFNLFNLMVGVVGPGDLDVYICDADPENAGEPLSPPNEVPVFLATVTAGLPNMLRFGAFTVSALGRSRSYQRFMVLGQASGAGDAQVDIFKLFAARR